MAQAFCTRPGVARRQQEFKQTARRAGAADLSWQAE